MPKPFDTRRHHDCELCGAPVEQTFAPGIHLWTPEFPRHKPEECIHELARQIKELRAEVKAGGGGNRG